MSTPSPGRTDEVRIPMPAAVRVAEFYCRKVCDLRRPQTHDPDCILFGVYAQMPENVDPEVKP